jgi:hypothetical protein
MPWPLMRVQEGARGRFCLSVCGHQGSAYECALSVPSHRVDALHIGADDVLRGLEQLRAPACRRGTAVAEAVAQGSKRRDVDGRRVRRQLEARRGLRMQTDRPRRHGEFNCRAVRLSWQTPRALKLMLVRGCGGGRGGVGELQSHRSRCAGRPKG